jgi:hypothetical protein
LSENFLIRVFALIFPALQSRDRLASDARRRFSTLSPTNVPPPPPRSGSGTPHFSKDPNKKTFHSLAKSPPPSRIPFLEPSHSVLDPLILLHAAALLSLTLPASAYVKGSFSLLVLVSWRVIIPLSASTSVLIQELFEVTGQDNTRSVHRYHIVTFTCQALLVMTWATLVLKVRGRARARGGGATANERERECERSEGGRKLRR